MICQPLVVFSIRTLLNIDLHMGLPQTSKKKDTSLNVCDHTVENARPYLNMRIQTVAKCVARDVLNFNG